MPLVRVLLCALALLLVLPTAARAGVVTVQGGTLRFTATAGESEWPTISDAGDALWVTDGSAMVTAGSGCQPLSSFATCAVAGVQRIVIETGDGADRVTLLESRKIPVEVDLGPGHDLVIEGDAPADIRGGEGDDWFVPSSRPDVGSTFDGGPGDDRADYSQRHGRLSLSLDGQANDGAAGERDNLLGVEIVVGGFDDDLITGSANADELDGGMGVDEIHGLGGEDTLEGGYPGVGDRLHGGADDDAMLLSGSVVADGGPGDDTFTRGAVTTCSGCVAIGGPGVDTVDFGGEQLGPSRISLDDLPNDGELGGTANFRSDIENLIGPDLPSVLVGSAGPNRIDGGSQDDVLIGGGGTDRLGGGDGLDTADFSTHTTPVTLTLDGRANDGAVGESDLIAADVEGLRGGSAADVLVGDHGSNLLDGGPGGDRISGGDGIDGVDYSLRAASVRARLDGTSGSGEAGEDDTIAADVEGAIGGAGDDRLTGNALDGYLIGGDGDDVLLDRGGKDELDGGAGRDQLDSFDGKRDTISCGGADDALWTNATDWLDESCEAVFAHARPADPEPTATPVATATASPTPERPAATPTPVPDPPRPADRTAPRATRLSTAATLRVGTLRRHGLAVHVRCDEPCRLQADLERRGRVVAAATRATPSSAERTLRLRLTAAGKRSAPRGTYRLKVTFTDVAGNRATVVRSVRLR